MAEVASSITCANHDPATDRGPLASAVYFPILGAGAAITPTIDAHLEKPHLDKPLQPFMLREQRTTNMWIISRG